MRRIRARGAVSASSSNGVRLIAPGVLVGSGLTSFSRAQAGSITSTTLAADGTTWSEVAADTPRFYGTDQGLLIEGERTNYVRNVRPNFGTAPPTTSRPTNWTNTNGNGFSNTTFLSTQTTNGMPTVRVQVNDTAAGALWSQAFDTITAVSAVAGDVVSGRVYVRLESASAAPLTYFIRLVPRDASSVTLSGGIITQTYTPTGTLTAVTVSGTMPASTAYVLLEWGCATTAAASYNFVQDFGAPQLGVGVDFVSSPIFNPAGVSSLPNVRGADLITASSTTLFPSGVGTILMKAVLPQNAPTGLEQMLVQMDDGTASERLRLRNTAGTANILFGTVTSAGGTVNATSLGTHTAGTAFKVGLSFDGTTIYGNLNGGTTRSIAGTVGAFNNFRVGMATAANSAMFGRVLYLDVLPYAVPDLLTAVTGLP